MSATPSPTLALHRALAAEVAGLAPRFKVVFGSRGGLFGGGGGSGGPGGRAFGSGAFLNGSAGAHPSALLARDWAGGGGDGVALALGMPPVGAPAGGDTEGVPATRVLAGEPLTLLAEPWVFFSAGAAGGGGGCVRGAVDEGGGGFTVPRAPVAGEASALAGAPASALTALVAAACGAGGRPPPRGGACAPLPTGVRFRPTSVVFTLEGLPTAGVYGAGGAGAALGAPPPAPHVLTLSPPAGALSVTVPGGSLNPGYAYRVTATLALAAQWAYDAALPAWAPVRPLLPPLAAAAAAALSPAAPPPAAYPVALSQLPVFSPSDAVEGTAALRAAGGDSGGALIYAHAPPAAGAVAISGEPGGGLTAGAQFDVASVDWRAPDGDVFSPPYAPRGASAASAALLASALPLPPQALAALVGAALLPGDAAAAAAAEGAGAPGGAAAVCGGAEGGGGGAPPPWAAALSLLSTPLGLTPAAACAAALAWVAPPARASASAPPAFRFSFRVALADPTAALAAVVGGVGGAPLAGFSAGAPLPWALALAASSALGGEASYLAAAAALGAPLAPPRAVPALSAARAFNLPPTASGALTVSATAEDEMGGVGLALCAATAAATLPAGAPPDALMGAAVALLGAASSGGGAGGDAYNPQALLSASVTAATLLSAAGGGGGAAPATLTAAVATAASSTAASLAAIAAAAPAGLDDGNLLAGMDALSALAGSGGGGGGAGFDSTVSALTGVLALAASASGGGGGGGRGAGAPAPLPAAAGTAALTALTSLLVARGGGGGGGGDAPLAPADVAAAGGVLSSLALAAVRGQSNGSATAATAVAFSTLSPDVVASGAPFCGAALALAAAPLSAGGGSIGVGGALPACGGSSRAPPPPPGGAPPPGLRVPPPSVEVPAGAAAALAAAAPAGAPLSLAVVQWGVSPVSETAGLGALAYPALRRNDTLAAAADAAAAAAAEAEAAAAAAASRAGDRRRVLAFSVSGLFSALTSFASVGDGGGGGGGGAIAPGGATAASNAALRAAAPLPRTSADRLPGRPLDSRVVSIRVLSGGGGAVAVEGLLFSPPLLVTVPLRDPSIVRWENGVPVGVEVGTAAFTRRAVTVSCPAPGAPPLPLGTQLRASYAAPPALAGLRARVVVANVSGLSFTAPTTDWDTPGVAPGDAGFGGAVVAGSGAGSAPAPAGLAPAAAPSHLLSTDCGPPFGNLTFLCGPGAGTITFACPAVVPAPACLLYSESTRAWSNSDCVVVNASESSVVCACGRLGAYVAVRYASLDLPGNDLFAADAPATRTLPPRPSRVLWAVAALFLVGAAGATAAGAGATRDGARAWDAAVGADGEVVALASAARAGGGGWAPRIASALLPPGKGAALSAKVAPAGEEEEPHPRPHAPPLHALAPLLRLLRPAPDAPPPARALALLLWGPVWELRAEVAWTTPQQQQQQHHHRARVQIPGDVKSALLALAPGAAGAVGSGGAGGGGGGPARRRSPTALCPLAGVLVAARGGPSASPLCAPCAPARFDHAAPAHLGALASAASLAGALLAAAGFYSFFFSSPTTYALPPLSGAPLLLVGALTAGAVGALSEAAGAAVRFAGAASWRARQVSLAAELRRRAAAAEALGGFSTPALARELAAAAAARAGARVRGSSVPLPLPLPPDAASNAPTPPPPFLLAAVRDGLLPPSAVSAAAALLAANARAGGAGEARYVDGLTTTLTAVRGGAAWRTGDGFGGEEGWVEEEGGEVAAPARRAPGGGPAAESLFSQWACETGWVEPPPLCVTFCGSALLCCGRHPSQGVEAFELWAAGVLAGEGGAAGGEGDDDVGGEVGEALAGGWAEVVGARAAAAGGAAASVKPWGAEDAGGGEGGEDAGERRRGLRLAGRGGGVAAQAPPPTPLAVTALFLLLAAALAISLYTVVLFGLLRGDGAAASLLAAWALGVGAWLSAVRPLAVAAAVAWHLWGAPAAAALLEPLPLVGVLSGARAWRRAAASPHLPAHTALGGRLALLAIASDGAGGRTRRSAAAAIAAGVPLSWVREAVHGAAHAACLAAAVAPAPQEQGPHAAAALRNKIMMLRVALPAAPPPPGGSVRAPAAAAPPETLSAAPQSNRPPADGADALDLFAARAAPLAPAPSAAAPPLKRSWLPPGEPPPPPATAAVADALDTLAARVRSPPAVGVEADASASPRVFFTSAPPANSQQPLPITARWLGRKLAPGAAAAGGGPRMPKGLELKRTAPLKK